jgi:hypothetical protein
MEAKVCEVKTADSRVILRLGLCVPAVSPLERQDRRNRPAKPCADSASWHIIASISVLRSRCKIS